MIEVIIRENGSVALEITDALDIHNEAHLVILQLLSHCNRLHGRAVALEGECQRLGAELLKRRGAK